MIKNPFTMYPDCIKDRALLKGILYDLYPLDKFKCNAILIAFDEGITQAIDGAVYLDFQLEGRFIKILVSSYGMNQENAKWAVEYWIYYYGVEVLGKQSNVQLNQDSTVSTATDINDVTSINDIISIKTMKRNEKIPKKLIQRYPEIEEEYGIEHFSIAFRKDDVYHHMVELDVVGEYSGCVNEYVMMIVMMYNCDGVLFFVDWDRTIKKGFEGTYTFSDTFKVPDEESISRIRIRFALDPNHLNEEDDDNDDDDYDGYDNQDNDDDNCDDDDGDDDLFFDVLFDEENGDNVENEDWGYEEDGDEEDVDDDINKDE